MVNTEWTAGSYGAEKGIDSLLNLCVALYRLIVNGLLKEVTYDRLPDFNLIIPTALLAIDSAILDPRKKKSYASLKQK